MVADDADTGADVGSDITIQGGHLLPEYYEEWSDTIAAFADEISQNTNTTLYAMSPQNEPDLASCGRSEPCHGNYDTTVMNGAGGGGTAPASMAVYQTSASDDIASKDPATVTDGVFTASLPAMSVTTFVSE
jgi:O-glycosyl hydrolase